MQAELGENVRSGVDGEIVAGIHRASGDQREHADQRLSHHGAVADEARVGFLVEHFRGGAGGDQRVESGNRAAGDGDEQEREQLALDDGAAAVDEVREGRKPDVGMNEEDTDDQHGDRAQLHVGGEIIARFEQQPDRQHGSDEAVMRHQNRDLVRGESERAGGAVGATQRPTITAAISRTTPKRWVRSTLI